jgi:hypothetical protein
VKELQELVTGQQHFVVLPAYEPMPVKERYIQHMSGAAMAVVLRQQQKVAAFAAGSDKETVQVCWQHCCLSDYSVVRAGNPEVRRAFVA